jgi:hypothetical protein
MLARENASTEVRVVYVLRRPEYRETFLDLMTSLREATLDLMTQAGARASDYVLEERRDRRGWFVEVLRFASEKEHSRFDEMYCQDRRTAALQALVDDLVDSSWSDYVVTRGR